MKVPCARVRAGEAGVVSDTRHRTSKQTAAVLGRQHKRQQARVTGMRWVGLTKATNKTHIHK